MGATLAATWAYPTWRALPAAPLACAAVTALAVGVLAASTDRWAVAPRGIVEVVLATALVASLHDPAAELVAASPTSLFVRRLHRLALAGPAVLGLWTVSTGAGATAGGTGWQVGPLLALATAGLAAVLVLPEPTGVLVGTTVPLCWGAAILVVPAERADLLLAWLHHPWWACTVVAGAAVVLQSVTSRRPR